MKKLAHFFGVLALILSTHTLSHAKGWETKLYQVGDTPTGEVTTMRSEPESPVLTIPGMPVIAGMPDTAAGGVFEFKWNMWWGDNGNQ